MDLLTFKKDHPDVAQAFAAEIGANLTEKFTTEKADLMTQLSTLQEENKKLSEESIVLEKKVLAFERVESERAQQALTDSADSAFAEKFTASGLPDRLSAKIRKLVDHTQFVADGKLDIEAFKSAVDAELKEWSGEESSVQGLGAAGRQSSGDGKGEQFKSECDAAADRMAGYVKGASGE